MPIEHLWALVVALAMLALGCTLQAAHYFHLLKMADNELAAFFTKLNALKQENDEKISQISHLSQLHKDQVEKIIQSYAESVERLINRDFEGEKRRALVNALRQQPNALGGYGNSPVPPSNGA